MKEKYVPIGSIVLLKGGTKKIMIYGRKQLSIETKTLFDYVACFYPEGNISEEYTFLFNHEQIDQIIFEGYSDEDDINFVRAVLTKDES